MTGVAATTGSRLHFGPLCWGEGLPRKFGGLGLMIDRPVQRLAARPAGEWSAEGPQADRVLGWARSAAGWFGERGEVCRPLRIRVEAAAPAHAGLGSGTQLALAAARLVAHFAGVADPSAADLAGATGRGKRSGVGLHGFERGGLIVEGGHATGSDRAATLPPLLTRVELPESWRVLVALPGSGPGLHGKPEAEAFRRLPPFPGAMVDRLCSLVLLGILPAVAEDDLEAFGAALEEIQALVGDSFAPAQGGRYAGPAVEAVVGAFRREGLAGVGQSSWGPAVYGFARHDPEAEGRFLARLGDRAGIGQLFWAIPARAGSSLESVSESWRSSEDGPSPAMA
jgi:beta-RFAP synthase